MNICTINHHSTVESLQNYIYPSLINHAHAHEHIHHLPQQPTEHGHQPLSLPQLHRITIPYPALATTLQITYPQIAPTGHSHQYH